MSKEVTPAQVMEYLSSLFTLLDELIDQHDVYKVRRPGEGDKMLVILPTASPTHTASDRWRQPEIVTLLLEP
jgi:hypothetical protein